MRFILRLLTWWNEQTLGTQIFTLRKGVKVGQDDQGNVYYKTRDDKRRWVIYSGETQASKIPPEWHGWLHHTWENPPTEVPLPRKLWEKPHSENLTGTMAAYAPKGSLRQIGQGPGPTKDYQPWTPE